MSFDGKNYDMVPSHGPRSYLTLVGLPLECDYADRQADPAGGHPVPMAKLGALRAFLTNKAENRVPRLRRRSGFRTGSWTLPSPNRRAGADGLRIPAAADEQRHGGNCTFGLLLYCAASNPFPPNLNKFNDERSCQGGQYLVHWDGVRCECDDASCSHAVNNSN